MIGDHEELARLRAALATTQAEHDALLAEVATLRATHATTMHALGIQNTHVTPVEAIAELLTTLATTQAERDALAAEVASLRTPVTDDALVKVAAKAICAVSCSATRRDGSGCECWDWQANELEARAVLAAISGPLVAAERERCAKIAEAAAWCEDMASAPRDKTLDLFNGKSRVPNCCFIDGRWGLLMNGYHIGVKPTHWRLPPAGPVT